MIIANAYAGKLKMVHSSSPAILDMKSMIETAQVGFDYGKKIGNRKQELILHLSIEQLQEKCNTLHDLRWRMEQTLIVVRKNMGSAIALVLKEIDKYNYLMPIPENRKAIVSILSFLPRSEATTAVSICHTWHELKWKVLSRTVRFRNMPKNQVYQFWRTALEERESKYFPKYQKHHRIIDKDVYHQYVSKASENPTLDPILQEVMHNDVRRSTFNDGVPMNEDETRILQVHLKRLLMAYAEFDPEVGYCQGMTFIAATILVRLEFDEALSFEAFANLMTVHQLREAFLPGLTGTIKKFKQLDHLISKHMKDLAGVFTECGIDASFFSSGWIMCLFTNHCGFKVSTVNRIMDIFMVDGWKGLFRIVLAIIELIRPMIMEADRVDVLPIIMTFAKQVNVKDENAIFQVADHFKVTDKYLRSIESADGL